MTQNKLEYETIAATVRRLEEAGWQAEEVAHADGYPVYALRSIPDSGTGEGEVPRLLIGAGVHGEEPGAVVGLNRWLGEHAEKWTDRVHLVVFPCLNPWGFERGLRHAANGEDLNRQFERNEHPAVRGFNEFISGESFHLFMDLHEDEDFETLYLYELIDASLKADASITLGRSLLDRFRHRVSLAQEPVGSLEMQDGLIGGDLDRETVKDFDNVPIALHVYAHHAPHVITMETPGKLDLDLRASLHVDSLEHALSYLVKRFD